MTPATSAAAVSHVGRVRSNNQDSGYSGTRLFVVADGMGGHAGGDIASAIAVQRIKETDGLPLATPRDAELALQTSMIAANQRISETVYDHPELTGMGTTVSALMRIDDVVVIAHIGDSRIYLLRDGELTQVTNDHTFVQRLVETGRITPEEAAVHPRRSVLMRVLGDIDQTPEIDTSVLGTAPGDRWLLCSDGLSSYVAEERIHLALERSTTAAQAADRLVHEALEHGAPDNVTTVVVDIDRHDERPGPTVVVGSAASPPAFELTDPARSNKRLPALLLHPIRGSGGPPEASFKPASEDYLDALVREDRRRRWQRRAFWLVALAVLLIAAVIGIVLTFNYTQTQYYVGVENGTVAVYRGVIPTLGPIPLSHVEQRTSLRTDRLPSGYAAKVRAGIPADSLSEARRIVQNLDAGTGGGSGG